MVQITYLQHVICELISDPSHVIGLYPNLLPDEFRNQLAYPDRMPELEGPMLEKGIFALIDYLTQVCHFSIFAALCETQSAVLS